MDLLNARIQTFDENGVFVHEWGNAQFTTEPQKIGIGVDGLFYVSEGFSNLVHAFGTGIVELRADPGELSWSSHLAATGYDLVTGDLQALRASGGDFSSSTLSCLADDLAGNSQADTDVVDPGEGRWYLVRPVDTFVGYYDSTGRSQLGARDEEIAASIERSAMRERRASILFCDISYTPTGAYPPFTFVSTK